MMCRTTGKLSNGSPPWNSMVSEGAVERKIMSTTFSAVSGQKAHRFHQQPREAA